MKSWFLKIKVFMLSFYHVCDFLECSFCIQKGQHLELQLLSLLTEGSVVWKTWFAQPCFVAVFSLLVQVLLVLQSTKLISSTFSLVPLMMDEALDYLEKRQVFSFCIQNSLFFFVLCITSWWSSHFVILVYIKTVVLGHLEIMLLSLISYS